MDKAFSLKPDLPKISTVTALNPQSPAATKSKTAPIQDAGYYLGLLYPIEEYRVYGFLTNTKCKLILVLDDTEVKDHEIKQLFRVFHQLVTEALSNPFYKQDEQIQSKKFDKNVYSMVRVRNEI